MKMSNATYYATMFKNWPKAAGDKPTEAMLATAHAFGRPGKQSLALAMAMRDAGVTNGQIVAACDAPQNNHRRDVLKRGYFKTLPAPLSEAGHKVYRIELTAKGKARVAKLEAATNEAAAGDKPAKRAKRKAASKPQPVTAPQPVNEPVTSEAVPVNEPVTA